MYTLKGFAVHTSLVNNQPGVTAVIGEMSDQSATFSKEKGYYKNDGTSNDIIVISVTGQLDGVDTTVPATIQTNTLTIVKAIYDQVMAGQPMDGPTLAQSLLSTFQSIAQGFQVGPVVQDTPNNRYAPSYVNWTDNSQDSQIRIWFTDADFQAEYDDYSITVVPPVDTLDDLFKLGATVEQIVNSRTIPQMIEKMNDARGNHPPTLQVMQTYNWIDPNNATHLVPTNWGALLYGPAGNSVDAIKNAFINYILANSTHTRDEWTAILPDLFRRTEFIFIPRFDLLGIPNNAVGYGIYSPQVNASKANALFKAQVPAYASGQVDEYLTVMSHTYRSLQLLVCGSTENRNNWFELNQVFSDIITVPSTSTDFARMAEATRTFLLNLDTMVQTAETMTAYSAVPAGFTRLTRDGKLYIVLNYQDIDFLVMSKASLLGN